MADSLDDRRRGMEAKWAHDEDTRFRVMARRNKLVGLWAAGEKGLSGEAADDFALSVIHADFEEAGDEDVFRKLRGELPATISDAVIRDKMATLLETAAQQVTSAA